MGRLADLQNSGAAQDWGYLDSRRLRSLRLDKEFRDSESRPEPSSLEPATIRIQGVTANNESLKREVRIQGELLESVRSSVLSLQKKKKGTY